jgi:hypothetical protein
MELVEAVVADERDGRGAEHRAGRRPWRRTPRLGTGDVRDAAIGGGGADGEQGPETAVPVL